MALALPTPHSPQGLSRVEACSPVRKARVMQRARSDSWLIHHWLYTLPNLHSLQFDLCGMSSKLHAALKHTTATISTTDLPKQGPQDTVDYYSKGTNCESSSDF